MRVVGPKKRRLELLLKHDLKPLCWSAYIDYGIRSDRDLNEEEIIQFTLNDLIYAKKAGFEPGGMSLHNAFVPHGPEAGVFEGASQASLAPVKQEHTMAFMFESRNVIQPTRWAMETPLLQKDYDSAWRGFPKATLPK